MRFVLAGMGILTLLWSGCASTAQQQLDALRAEPLAQASWDGVAEVATRQSDPQASKPGQPYYTRCFSTSLAASDAMALIQATAREVGWQAQDDLSGAAWVARRTVDGQVRTLILSTDLADCDSITDAALRLTLTYQ